MTGGGGMPEKAARQSEAEADAEAERIHKQLLALSNGDHQHANIRRSLLLTPEYRSLSEGALRALVALGTACSLREGGIARPGHKKLLVWLGLPNNESNRRKLRRYILELCAKGILWRKNIACPGESAEYFIARGDKDIAFIKALGMEDTQDVPQMEDAQDVPHLEDTQDVPHTVEMNNGGHFSKEWRTSSGIMEDTQDVPPSISSLQEASLQSPYPHEERVPAGALEGAADPLPEPGPETGPEPAPDPAPAANPTPDPAAAAWARGKKARGRPSSLIPKSQRRELYGLEYDPAIKLMHTHCPGHRTVWYQVLVTDFKNGGAPCDDIYARYDAAVVAANKAEAAEEADKAAML